MFRRLFALLALVAAPLVFAQDDAFMGMFNGAQQIQSNYMGAVMGSAAVGGAAENARHSTASRTRSAARADPALKLPYRPSPDITVKLKHEMADTLVKEAPAAKAAEIRTFVDKGDFVGEFDRDMASYGYPLRSGDVVDAFAAYWLCMWAIANDRQQPAAAQARNVREQVARMMSGNATLVNADNRTRQLVAEAWITETEMALSLRDFALHNGRDTGALAENTYRNVLAKGIDLRAIRLAEDGFVRR